MSSILHEANLSILHMVLVFIAGILLQLLVVWRIAKVISTPIRKSSRLLNMMAKGNIVLGDLQPGEWKVVSEKVI